MDKKCKKTIIIDSQKVEVDNEIYQVYTHGARKERYFMKDLKRETIRIDGEKITFKHSREDSLERLQTVNQDFADTTTELPEEAVEKNILLEQLAKAKKNLTDEELLVLKELFFYEKTEREVSRNLNISLSGIHRCKVKALAKLRKYLESGKNF